MVEVRFKPSLVGTVADGAITSIKLATALKDDIDAKAVATDVNTALSGKADIADLANKVDGIGTTGDKKITKIGFDSVTGEVVIDHE